VKDWLKSVLNYRSYPKNKTGGPFFWTTLYNNLYCAPKANLILFKLYWTIKNAQTNVILIFRTNTNLFTFVTSDYRPRCRDQSHDFRATAKPRFFVLMLSSRSSTVFEDPRTVFEDPIPAKTVVNVDVQKRCGWACWRESSVCWCSCRCLSVCLDVLLRLALLLLVVLVLTSSSTHHQALSTLITTLTVLPVGSSTHFAVLRFD